jgi:hypothetical protein
MQASKTKASKQATQWTGQASHSRQLCQHEHGSHKSGVKDQNKPDEWVVMPD